MRRKIKKPIKIKKSCRKSLPNNLWELSKLKIKGGPKDLSERLDHYLYEG
jgi:hypothetical protein